MHVENVHVKRAALPRENADKVQQNTVTSKPKHGTQICFIDGLSCRQPAIVHAA